MRRARKVSSAVGTANLIAELKHRPTNPLSLRSMFETGVARDAIAASSAAASLLCDWRVGAGDGGGGAGLFLLWTKRLFLIFSSSRGRRSFVPSFLRSFFEGRHQRNKSSCVVIRIPRRFLHHELPIRMAQRIDELRQMPLGLSAHPSVKRVIDYYEDGVRQLVDVPFPESAAEEERFAGLVGSLLSDKATVPASLFAAVRAATCDARPTTEASSSDAELLLLDRYTAARHTLDEALSRFFTARVGLRLLVEHYLELRTPGGHPGIIDDRCRPFDVARSAIAGVRDLFEAQGHGLVAPEVLVAGDLEAELTYVSRHMHESLFEIIKNSTRAVSLKYVGHPTVPPLKLIIAAGSEDVTIKLEDLGGGTARSARHMGWSWFWSSEHLRATDATKTPFAGRGIGLPYTRVLARYFGGELSLRPMEGYGTDAYLHLERLGTSCENLPAPVIASPANSDSTLPPGYSYLDEDRPLNRAKASFFMNNNNADPEYARRRAPPPSAASASSGRDDEPLAASA